MSTSASTKLPPSKEPTPEQNGTISELISSLKSSFRLADFERVAHTLTARDEAARKQTSFWKAQFESMEKKHGEVALEKLITEEELRKLKREHDLLRAQVARAESGLKVSEGREKRWKERYEKVEREKASLGRRVSALELEKDKAVREAEESQRRFEELNRRREEDAAVLTGSGVEERREKGFGPVKVAEMGGVVADDELVRDGKEGGSGDENLTEPVPVVKESGSKCGVKAESLPRGGGSAPVSVEVGSSHREHGSKLIIEIDDSDDEMPTRKRVLSNDDNDGTKPTKKHHTKSLEELMEKMTDFSDSSDTGDSSSSGSDIDSKSEIARLCRKFAEK